MTKSVALVVPNHDARRQVQPLFDPKTLRVVVIGDMAAGTRYDAIMVTREAWMEITDYPNHEPTAASEWWRDMMLCRLSGPEAQVIYL